MNKDADFQTLEEEFAATFIKDLIPGILHNFANPLNSIMGRSKLLQRRFEDIAPRLQESGAMEAFQDNVQKMAAEIRAINHEVEILYELFKSLSGKFYLLDAKGESRINLSQLLADEMKFFHFYLDFKHEIKKTVKLDWGVPSFKGNSAELALAFWKLIRFCVIRALASVMKEFYLETMYDQQVVTVLLRDTGGVLPAAAVEGIMKNYKGDMNNSPATVIDRGIMNALSTFKKYRAEVTIHSEEGGCTIKVSFPYQQGKSRV